ncbi:MAG: beta-N-acetylhexosaminidase [Gammaproteobacteria bacterium]|nr:beta-N-acetylhexosaminidase [Gammaproteobacteria bacterium]
MSFGPIMLDLRGTALEADEREILLHPLVGGVNLFSRNHADPAQLRALTDAIHALRQPPLLIATDHEGGRVQRFHQGFCALPPCRAYGLRYDESPDGARRLAEQGGWLMASELLAVGVDFSFAPVLDLDRGVSAVIGERAFHGDPDVVATLGRSFVRGMRAAGMAAVGKHFPGHGGVGADSHHETPVDGRTLEDILLSDLVPFERLIEAGLPAIMPAHVIFPDVDRLPAGFSREWLGGILRRRLGFTGAIFSDDISMAGAEVAGDYAARAAAALRAGCDMVLVCNNQTAAAGLLDSLQLDSQPASQVRLIRMHGARVEGGLESLRDTARWRESSRALAELNTTPELGLGDDMA